jgi:hypothetical protein
VVSGGNKDTNPYQQESIFNGKAMSTRLHTCHNAPALSHPYPRSEMGDELLLHQILNHRERANHRICRSLRTQYPGFANPRQVVSGLTNPAPTPTLPRKPTPPANSKLYISCDQSRTVHQSPIVSSSTKNHQDLKTVSKGGLLRLG